MKLQIAEGLSLPLDVVTEKLAFLGRTGQGKTYAAMKLAELMLGAGVQILALDAVGKWYGLRVAGMGPGFTLPVFGGLHGDYPLEATGGKLLADVLVDRALAAVIDVSQFTHGEQIRFSTDFATHFYQRKKAAPSAVHLFLEESQEYVPQNPQPNEGQMLAAFERLWKLGRNFGIGGSLISQRPQEINKKALNQTGTLFVFQMTGPQERKAIEAWVSAQGIDEDIAEVLPTLTPGHPHVWSPTFLRVSKTVQILEKQTADVSSTPKVGARTKERPLTPIDAEQLKTEMAATVERAKSEDPKELRKRLFEKDREIAALTKVKPTPAVPQTKTVQTFVLKDGQLVRLEKAGAALGDLANRLFDLTSQIQALWKSVGAAIELTRQPQPTPKSVPWLPAPVRREPTRLSLPATPRTTIAAPPGRLPPGERAVLTAAAQYPTGVTREQLSILTGYKRSSRDAYIQRLREKGFIAASSNGHVLIESDGLAALGPTFEPLPTGQALREYWIARLPPGERAVLEAVLAIYPRALRRETIIETTGYQRSSRDAYIQRLRARQLVTNEGRGDIRASDDLFSG